jgi:hypothetical protein
MSLAMRMLINSIFDSLMAVRRLGWAACSFLILAACSPDKLVGAGDLPPTVIDPAATHTPAGAVAAYHDALYRFQTALGGFSSAERYGQHNGSFILISGILSDELRSTEALGAPRGTITATGLGVVDARTLPEYADPAYETSMSSYKLTYSLLQIVRGQSQEAIGLLNNYAPGAKALVGHLEAIQGYSEIMLADLFCSGVPLSTVDYNGDYTTAAGSSTEQVYTDAVALLDRALAVAGDSTRVVELARVGKGRALLDLGRYAEAANAVAQVPDDFRYLITFSSNTADPANPFGSENFVFARPGDVWVATMVDREGNNGLDFLSSGDPRTAAVSGGSNGYGVSVSLPAKYAATGDSPIVLADGVEARLIEAEAALRAGDVTTWLTKLNHLRETAISPALSDTTDPGTPDARIGLTFRERAFWLFLTGHRQGDLRRLMRQAGLPQQQLYPTGAYPGANGAYGSDVTAPVPATERAYNPKFTGCISRGA